MLNSECEICVVVMDHDDDDDRRCKNPLLKELMNEEQLFCKTNEEHLAVWQLMDWRGRLARNVYFEEFINAVRLL